MCCDYSLTPVITKDVAFKIFSVVSAGKTWKVLSSTAPMSCSVHEGDKQIVNQDTYRRRTHFHCPCSRACGGLTTEGVAQQEKYGLMEIFQIIKKMKSSRVSLGENEKIYLHGLCSLLHSCLFFFFKPKGFFCAFSMYIPLFRIPTCRFGRFLSTLWLADSVSKIIFLRRAVTICLLRSIFRARCGSKQVWRVGWLHPKGQAWLLILQIWSVLCVCFFLFANSWVFILIILIVYHAHMRDVWPFWSALTYNEGGFL